VKARIAPSASAAGPSRRFAALAGLAIVGAGLAAYAGSFSGPFIFDDGASILGNPTIRHFWSALSPPHAGGLTVNGRPVLNLSLALNYAVSGEEVWSYHALNLAIHLLAALVLFGIVRRTLARVPGPGREAGLLAAAIAAWWAVHPLQTEAVTYVIQRAESLMGLCYLLTLYGFIRYAGFPTPAAGARAARAWAALSVVACLLGMATKEVMVSAPVLVLLYDRTFVAGSFRRAWQARRPYYGLLAATWLLLAGLVAGTGGNRGGSVGFGVAPAWPYWLSQFGAITRYLRLAVWPHPLVFEYGAQRVTQPGAVLPAAVLVLLLAAGTAAALWRRPALGFLGAWFFAILAPTSLLPGTTETTVEYRMYLPLAAVLAGLALALHQRLGKWGLLPVLAAIAACAVLTARRNEDYRSAVAIWSDTVAKRPENARAHYDLGYALFHAGQPAEAIAEYREAIRLRPDDAEAHNNLGNALAQSGRAPEAIAEYHEALRLHPNYAAAHNNLGNTLAQSGRLAEAVEQFRAVVGLDPGYAKGHRSLAQALADLGRRDDAIAQYQEALRLDPGDPWARNNLAELQAAPR
jgi:tetratricopeptide (TPR) repeat protein